MTIQAFISKWGFVYDFTTGELEDRRDEMRNDLIDVINDSKKPIL